MDSIDRVKTHPIEVVNFFLFRILKIGTYPNRSKLFFVVARKPSKPDTSRF